MLLYVLAVNVLALICMKVESLCWRARIQTLLSEDLEETYACGFAYEYD